MYIYIYIYIYLSLPLSLSLARLVVPLDPTTIMHIRSGNRSFLIFWALVLPQRLATSVAQGTLKRPRAQLRPWQGMARDGNSKLANPREHVGRTSTWKIWRTKRLKFDTCINLYQFVSLISVNGGFSSAARGL